MTFSIQFFGVRLRPCTYSKTSTPASASRLIVYCVSNASRPMDFCSLHDEHLEGRQRLNRGQESLQGGPLRELSAAEPVIGEGVLVGDGPTRWLAKALAFSTCRVTDLASGGDVLLRGFPGVDRSMHVSPSVLPLRIGEGMLGIEPTRSPRG
jgi:hypothetical protein